MSDIELVIKIPEDIYKEIMAHNRERREGGKSAYYFEELIQNGIPLPKGHGALKDADALINSLGASDRDIYCKAVIEEEAPTLIEAESEG